ncbi:TonB family protein [Hyphobacterium marinum]|uniref:TonB family protein n=1 Tax=Hyphobacterium marinum TaxID=3116574 RepID=A0ABU7LUI2_9PROT|nr:TonB family protein [Hyphobacterium sp. Y6023]MEE2565199.1 TonB family protein [Hyphobacterium sp. Y6023]
MLGLRCLVLIACAALAACSALPDVPGSERLDPRSQPFFPTSDFPVTPNVEALIGPEDCQGATLAAQQFDLPEYPARAYARGLQGWVVVRFHVYDTGRTHRVRVARAVPSGHFSEASVDAVEDWLFRTLQPGQALSNCVVMFEYRMGRVRIR